MNIKIRLTVTGQNPPNRVRQLIKPRVIAMSISEKKVDAFIKKIDAAGDRLESVLKGFKGWLKS